MLHGWQRRTSRFVLNIDYGAMSWFRMKHPIVALLVFEAEYITFTENACYLDEKNFGGHKYSWTISNSKIFCDNKATISMTKYPIFHGKMKHIELRHHIIKDVAAKGMIMMKYCPTNDQVEYGFTTLICKFCQIHIIFSSFKLCIK